MTKFRRAGGGVRAYWLAGALPLMAGCASSRQAVQTDALPLRRVVIYRNGVGYFEREGRVDAARVRFRVRGSEVGDFLATMAVIEKGGSSVRSASFPIQVDEPDDDDDDETTAAPEASPDATPKGVSRTPPEPPKKKKKKKRDPNELVAVNLDLDGKSHQISVGYVAETPVWRPSYRLVVQPGGAADLQAWGIVQNLSGEDWTGVRLSLVAGAPLAFQATLGTPVVPPRPSVTDEGEVVQAIPQSETSLGQGPAPAPPPPPPSASPTSVTTPAPDVDHDGIVDSADEGKAPGSRSDVSKAEKRRAKKMVPPKSPARSQLKNDQTGYGGLARGAGSAAAAPPAQPAEPSPMRHENPSAPRNVSALAAAAVEGSTTRYDIPLPVTIPDKAATMVLLTSKRVTGESSFLFAPAAGVADSGGHPFRVARFTNQTNGLLERGPIAVFENGAFLGQGIVDPLPPGATATVPFALDRSVGIDNETATGEQGARVAKIEGGVLSIERDLQFKTTYHVRNGNEQRAHILIKHPRRPGTRLFQPPKGTEDNTGTSSALVPGDTLPRSSADVVVDERMVTTRAIDWFQPLADEAVLAYVRDPRADPQVVAQLRAAWQIRPELVKLFEEERTLRDEQNELARNTEETRLNLKSLEKNPAAAALRAQLSERLAKSAARLNEITKRLVELQLAQNERRVRFLEAVRSIKLTGALPAPV